MSRDQKDLKQLLLIGKGETWENRGRRGRKKRGLKFRGGRGGIYLIGLSLGGDGANFESGVLQVGQSLNNNKGVNGGTHGTHNKRGEGGMGPVPEPSS